jgi:hypothetical protein
MAPVPVEIAPPRPAHAEEGIVFVEDLDALAEAATNMGCGDDNPHR